MSCFCCLIFGDEMGRDLGGYGFWLGKLFGRVDLAGGSLDVRTGANAGLEGCNRRATTTAPALDRSPSGDESERFLAVQKLGLSPGMKRGLRIEEGRRE